MSDTGTEEIVVPDTVEELLGQDEVRPDVPWIVIVWNDPVNLMTYVTFVFQKLFGYSRAKATKLMLQVHNEGKAVVAAGTREKCEIDVARLHAYGLWATMQRDEQVRTFKRRRDGRLVVTLPQDAVIVLRQITDDLGRMVAAREPGPVTDRMFPRAYLDPTEEDAEHDWEQLVHDDLTRSRTEALESFLADLDRAEPTKGDRMQIVLEGDAESRWLTALNDARLALGTLLGVSEEDEQGAAAYDEDPRSAGAQLYSFLTGLLGELVEVLLDEAPEEGVD